MTNLPWTSRRVAIAFLIFVLFAAARCAAQEDGAIIKAQLNGSGSNPQKGSIKLDLQVDEDSSVFTKTVMVKLSSLDAAEVEPFVRKSLSKYGSVSVNSQDNSLVITDREPKLSDLIGFVGKMDNLGMKGFVRMRTEVIKLTNVQASTLVNVVGQRLTGDGSVQADDGLNVLIVTDVEGKISYVKDIISQLDLPAQQIIIEAKIVQLNDSDFSDVGIDITKLLNMGAFSLQINNTVQKSSYIGSSNYRDKSSNKSNYLDLDVNPDQLINILVGTGRARVVATPTIVTLNNKKGSMSKILYPSSYYNPVVTDYSLEALPIIGTGGLITIDFKATAEEMEQPAITTSSGAGTPGTTPKRAIESTIIVREGETFVVGGLDYTYRYNSVRKTPLLGDIPVIKYIFRKKQTLTNTSRLIFFITPRIVPDQKNPLADDQKKM